MKKTIAMILLLFICSGMVGCVGISFYFQPDIDSNVRWSTEDGSVWFISDGKENPAEINGVAYRSAFDYSDKLDFLVESDIYSDVHIRFSCQFKRNKIIATVEIDKDQVLGEGAVIIFYKYKINEQ